MLNLKLKLKLFRSPD